MNTVKRMIVRLINRALTKGTKIGVRSRAMAIINFTEKAFLVSERAAALVIPLIADLIFLF